MLLLEEKALLADGGVLEIALRTERGVPCYRLRYGRAGRWLLDYGGDARGHRRSLRGNAAPYAFRSVEQLRYDFERDLEALADGDEAADA